MVTVFVIVNLSSLIFGADMWNFLGSLAGGLMSMFGQRQANQQNQQMASGAYQAQQILQEAQTLGVSPLAVLGHGSFQPGPAQNVFADMPAIGQQLGRAAAANAGQDDRLAALRIQNAQLQNTALSNDIIAQTMRNAQHATMLGSAGNPPGYSGVPLPVADPRYTANEPGLTRFITSEGVDVQRSTKAAESAFSGDPVAMAVNIGRSLEQRFPWLAGLPYGWNLGAQARPWMDEAAEALGR